MIRLHSGRYHAHVGMKRLFLLALGLLGFMPLSGCTAFQQLSTNKWLDASWFENESGRSVDHILTRWESRVRVTENSQAGGAPLMGLVGRVYFFNDDSKSAVDANGAVVVQMFDMTDVQPGVQPRKVAIWQFDPHSLKRLKRDDVVGTGYTLFLPWEEYDPNVRKVHLHVGYYPHKGAPYFANPQMLSLQTDDAPPPSISERQITSRDR